MGTRAGPVPGVPPRHAPTTRTPRRVRWFWLEARRRWHGTLVARTSVHNVLFTLPGDDAYPFVQSVTVAPRDGGGFEVSWDGGRLQEKRLTDLQHVDGLLDAFLERLTSPTLTCRECGGRVLVSARWFETFERMHYTCFHYAFEHEAFRPGRRVHRGRLPVRRRGPLARPERPARRAGRTAPELSCARVSWPRSRWTCTWRERVRV